MKTLGMAQWVIISTLHAARNGLTSAELVDRTGYKDVSGILRRLAAKDLDWKAVIKREGRTFRLGNDRQFVVICSGNCCERLQIGN